LYWGLCPQTAEILRFTARIRWTPGRAALDPGESRPPSRRSGCVSAEPYPPLGCNQYNRPETSTCGNVYTKSLTPPSGSAAAAATTYGNTTVARGYGSAQGIAVPVMQETRYLTVVEPRSGLALLTLSCRRREINGNSRTGKILVNRLKERFPKDQR